MKIILFTDSLGSGGAQRQLCGLAVLLKNKGYNVKIATYHDAPFYEEYLNENNVEHELIPNSSNTFKRLVNVYLYFKREKPDWVIAYQETPSLVSCVAKLFGAKFKLLVSERNTTQRLTIRDRIRFNLYRLANAIIPNSYAQGDYLVSRYPWMHDKCLVISNFVDMIEFYPLYKERGDIPKFIIVGSISEPKNTKRLIDACRLLKDKGVKVRIEWYGWTESPSSYMIECSNLISQYDLTDYITFQNKQLNISSKYREAEYFCIPSIYEGTPNVLCEAVACGLPVIGSDVCDNARYIKDGVNGFLFNPLDSNSIADCFMKIISLSNVEYESFCKQSRNLAVEKLSSEIFVNKYLSVIHDEMFDNRKKS